MAGRLHLPLIIASSIVTTKAQGRELNSHVEVHCLGIILHYPRCCLRCGFLLNGKLHIGQRHYNLAGLQGRNNTRIPLVIKNLVF